MSRRLIHRVCSVALALCFIGMLVGVEFAAWSVRPSAGLVITGLYVFLAVTVGYLATGDRR